MSAISIKKSEVALRIIASDSVDLSAEVKVSVVCLDPSCGSYLYTAAVVWYYYYYSHRQGSQ